MARNTQTISPVVPAADRAETGIAPLRIAGAAPAGFDPVGRIRFDISRAFGATNQDRWSPLGTSLFLLVACGTFWGLVALALLIGRH